MILDRIEHCKDYKAISENFKAAFEFLEREDLSELPCGKYEIKGNDVFVNISEYETKPLEELRTEFHRDYADIQYIIRGNECMGWKSALDCTVKDEYDPGKDIGFYNEKAELITLKEKEFAVFFPQDGHAPKGSTGSVPSKVRKALAKVRVN